MAAAVASKPKHDRCGRELSLVRGEWYCLKCFVTVEIPVLTPEEAEREVRPDGRQRNRQPSHVNVPWSEEERRAWETWKEGDPVPGEEREMEPEGIKTLNTRELGASCVESLRYLAEQAALLDAKRARIAEEAKKLVDVAKLCGTNVPADLEALAKGGGGSKPKKRGSNAGPARGEFECRQGCGFVSPTAQGRGAHERFNHGAKPEEAAA